jgi:hypothetical protein
MIRDLDIYRSANVLIREHGEAATLDQPYRVSSSRCTMRITAAHKDLFVGNVSFAIRNRNKLAVSNFVAL